ncbi:MAG: hypothetical protein NW701_12055 [Nitrospira sp.]
MRGQQSDEDRASKQRRHDTPHRDEAQRHDRASECEDESMNGSLRPTKHAALRGTRGAGLFEILR